MSMLQIVGAVAAVEGAACLIVCSVWAWAGRGGRHVLPQPPEPGEQDTAPPPGRRHD